ncbi:Putative Fe-S cluster [Desulfacinum hydrothermale DSM 13146]|uniref:Putative Fe-S cluster n=1 Tax=Desulfacinum hydrothermale DSM 13146 TaxID=1121390 RepID=A0A1W1X2Y7_9BACT|nr:(Fe-S)-binding protein [Desulfacinum hydrothermale]SMC17771.1 Putative Fe-S cluster [Desulfacinum hydrothermale DSM 13146]
MDRLSTLKKTFDEVERGLPGMPFRTQPVEDSWGDAPASQDLSFEQFLERVGRNGRAALGRTARETAAVLGRIFGLSREGAALVARVEESLRALFQTDHAFGVEEGNGVSWACLRDFRRLWFEAVSNGREGERLFPGLAHAARVGFFNREPVDIAPWVRWILQVEHYHRTDPARHEDRLDRYRFLRQDRPDAPLVRAEDLLVWTEQELFRDFPARLEDKAQLCARSLQHRLAPGISYPEPLPALIYLLLRCHRFCLSEVLDPKGEERALVVEASRQIQSLTDLMLLIYRRCLPRAPLPDAVSVLEELVQAGFNVEHETFKDPYVASLVPPDQTPTFDEAVVRLLVDPETLTGDLDRDCGASSAFWLDAQRQALEALDREVRDMHCALERPLPRKDLLRRCLRFMVSWSLSGHLREDLPQVSQLAGKVRACLPEDLIRCLVRQRRGFEVTSRKELQSLLEKECERQLSVLEKVLSDGRLEGEADFQVMVRLAALSSVPFPEKETGEGFPLARRLEAVLKRLGSFSRTSELLTRDFQFFLETPFPPQGTPFEMVEAVRCVIPREAVVVGLGKEGFSEKEAAEAYERTLWDFAGAFHRLTVASRSPHVSFDSIPEPEELQKLLAVLVAPLGELQASQETAALKEFRSRFSFFLRRHDGQLLLRDQEWEVAAAHWAVTVLGPDLDRVWETRRPDEIRACLEKEAGSWDAPADIALRNPVARLVLEWMDPGGQVSVDPDLVQALVDRLPGLDCGSCGEPRCRRFALGLLAGRYQPSGCGHLTAPRSRDLQQRLQQILAAAGASRVSRSVFQLMADPGMWRRISRRHPLKRAVKNALGVKRQKTRRILMQKLEALWDSMERKPDIYRRPDVESFYRALVETVGFEAAERITEEERRWLVQYGRRRVDAEWARLELRRDWLKLSRLKVASRPRLEEADPVSVAERAYDKLFYLSQLDEEDRRRLLLRRLEAHEDGFSLWWNQDLISMNHPRYLIDNWEEFSKVVKNAYWHQEDFPAPRRLAREIYREWSHGGEVERLAEDWIGFTVENARQRLADQGAERGETSKMLKDVSDLRRVLEGLVMRIEKERNGNGSGRAEGEPNPPIRDALWQAFQQGGYVFHPDFSVSREDLEPWERERLQSRMDGSGEVFAGPMPPDTAARVLVEATAKRYERQRQVADWLEKTLDDTSPQNLPSGALESWVQDMLRRGASTREVAERIRSWFATHPVWKEEILVEWIGRLTAMARWQDLVSAFPGVVIQELHVPFLQRFADLHPEWFQRIQDRVRRHGDFDRERLLHYLFVLAKMEGNLDVITGLLREIRETSDVIEAAWLQFTKDRLAEGPPPAPSRTLPAGIPLLAGRIKDKEALYRALTEGVSRSEKRAVGDAVRELLLFMRFHIVQLPETVEDPELGFRAFLDAGYNLEGLDPEVLHRAFVREWQRRSAHGDNRIWIMTMAVARRCAALSPELQEADRAFVKVRQHLLKEETAREVDAICRARGIALGKVKEQVYRELSELLERERLESFRKRIRQMVQQLDRKRLEIVKSWVCGEINRFSVFHILRQRQKGGPPPSSADFRRFIVDQWMVKAEDLRWGEKEDAHERLQELDESFQALLGVALLELEKEARSEAERALEVWRSECEERIRQVVARAFMVAENAWQ